MNRPSGSSEFARGASAAALKGALLIGLAVVVGIFLLQKVDTSNAGSGVIPVQGAKTTTTTVRSTTTTTGATTTTAAATPAKTPAQLRVLVLNGGAASGEAGKMHDELAQVGYTNQAQANTWSGHNQTGATIMCRPGQEGAAVALSQQTPLQGAQVVTWATGLPSSVSSDVDCVVVVGA